VSLTKRKIWTYSQPHEETCLQISQKFSLHPAVSAVLYNRGMSTGEQVERFLHAGLESAYDPFLLKDMEKAVDRILKAVARDEKVAIYGDFDVDGLTSMHVLGRFLSALQIECSYYVPNRLTEGYGLSRDGLATCHAQGATLLITVDCGISSVEEIAYATGLGMDAIVVDHHEPEPTLPRCCAVIDPKRPDCSYPFSELAGVGVAYKLCQAILEKLAARQQEFPRHGDLLSSPRPDPREILHKMIDMVALGTVADLAPLVDENR
jgi:single-stranded-DNA-specific exonuclease